MEAAAEEKTNSISPLKKLSRNRRNIAYYRSQPDYWGWYRYYMDTNNQEGVSCISNSKNRDWIKKTNV